MDIHYMRLEMENYDVSIRGKDFEIEYYGCDELKMKGKIKVIECHEHGL
jgi:YabP family.